MQCTLLSHSSCGHAVPRLVDDSTRLHRCCTVLGAQGLTLGRQAAAPSSLMTISRSCCGAKYNIRWLALVKLELCGHEVPRLGDDSTRLHRLCAVLGVQRLTLGRQAAAPSALMTVRALRTKIASNLAPHVAASLATVVWVATRPDARHAWLLRRSRRQRLWRLLARRDRAIEVHTAGRILTCWLLLFGRHVLAERGTKAPR
mmetsp:Transcript_3176/g.8295  ORF Transcript_3176/g.8295 Transcript_3176/m.8295 type:complete len:202 (+) Transcript_3176:442-1047(+)